MNTGWFKNSMKKMGYSYEISILYERLNIVIFTRSTTSSRRRNGINTDMRISCGYRIDLLIKNTLIVKLKCVEELLPVQSAQILTLYEVKQ